MRVGRLFGIDVFINVSWLFVFALVAWSLASDVGPLRAVDIPPLPRACLGVVTALLFFMSVLIHELAHSLLARSRGVKIRGITLFIFGGVSMLESEAETAPAEAWISLIGPLASFALFIIFTALTGLLAVAQPQPLQSHDWRTAMAVASSYLACANLLLATFNLLPAYPLDGGRILHALIWRFGGSRRRATAITIAVGRIIAACIVLLGIASTLFEREALGGGLWLTFIGWFLFQAGETEGAVARLGEALRGHVAAELAAPPACAISADTTAEEALQKLLHQQVHAAPIFLGERLIGMVTLQELVRVPEPTRTYVTAVMTPASEIAVIRASADAGEVTRALTRGGTTLLPVEDDNGELLGFITREGVVAWMSTTQT